MMTMMTMMTPLWLRGPRKHNTVNDNSPPEKFDVRKSSSYIVGLSQDTLNIFAHALISVP